jgi:hypothetical protein
MESLEQISQDAIKIVKDILANEHCMEINRTLNGYEKFLTFLSDKSSEMKKSMDETSVNNSDELYALIAPKWNRTVGKVFHFHEYEEQANKNYFIAYVARNVLTTLKDYIVEYNTQKATLTEDALEAFLATNKQNYEKICKEIFIGHVPCLEATSENIQTYLNVLRTPRISTNIVASPNMTIADFLNDGGYGDSNPDILLDHEYVSHLVTSFRLALCGSKNSCSEDYPDVKIGFNDHNFSVFLDYLNQRYNIYEKMSKDKILEWINMAYEVNEEDNNRISPYSLDGVFCCQQNIRSGGKRSRRKRSRRKRSRRCGRYTRK